MVSKGVLNVVYRELRFIEECALKLYFVQQEAPDTSINDKLEKFNAIFESPSITFKRKLRLHLLPSELREPFLSDLGRLYGATSKYVHLSTTQINQLIESVDAGRTVGYESVEDIEKLNNTVATGFAGALVLLLHSVPEHVAGDLLVQPDGSTHDWYFTKSKYIAAIDEQYDYKAERKEVLASVRQQRKQRIEF
jgi:hypothetical protein